MVKNENLKGKIVEVVPWHKTFKDKNWIIKGKLKNIKAYSSTSYDPDKKKRIRRGTAYSLVIVPTAEQRKDLLVMGLMKKNQRVIYRSASGHKVRMAK